MPFPPTSVDRSGTGKISYNPNNGVYSTMYPIAGLTQSGLWIPFQLAPDGSLVVTNDTASGMPHLASSQQETTPGADQVLLDETVPAQTTRTLNQVSVVTRVSGTFFVYLNGSIIGSGRTGPGCYGVMSYLPGYQLAAGQEYQVIFTSREGSPIQSVECYFQASDVVAS